MTEKHFATSNHLMQESKAGGEASLRCCRLVSGGNEAGVSAQGMMVFRYAPNSTFLSLAFLLENYRVRRRRRWAASPSRRYGPGISFL